MVRIYTKEEIDKIARSGAVLARTMAVLKKEVAIGVTLKHLDDVAREYIRNEGGEPAFLNYQPGGAEHPYMASICTSINEIVVHGFPTDRTIKVGDVLKVDCGVLLDGMYSDSAFTVIAGKGTQKAQNLVKATHKALEEAIKAIRPGAHIGDIGYAVEYVAKRSGVSVVQGLTGHGVGYGLHEDPYVYNYGNKGEGLLLKPGMVFAIEPMLCTGRGQVKQLKDESWAMVDKGLSAQF
ncbi:MAG: Methionine aminopeptidase [Candidatus Wolfebacteria bacterium GW2011_GWE1_48_7]|nr:MAG: Methionine aminopeptidase [Candidatus Wolfebacteria bacterium GW2011_GWE1_48_7]